MKRLLLIALTIFAGTAVTAQEEPDTTRFRIGNQEIIITRGDTTIVNTGEEDEDDFRKYGDDDDLTYWSGFEVGINLPVTGDFGTSFDSKHLQIDPSQSFVYNINLLEKRIKIINDYFGIVTGIGFTNSRYGFKDNSMRLASNADSTFGVVDTNLFNGFSKNQLRVNTFNVPLLFQINTSKNEDKNFHLAFGAIGGVRIGSNVKYKYDLAGGGDTKNKEKGRYNLNAFQVLGTVRMGYNDFGLFANYNILSLYEKDKSELAYPLTFGLSLHF
ncbi:MAG: outer membrane beta-barrel protein [Crocinitomix sp.]|nr:outer membrane beta-barrel protein [Crocinitomix sp.]